MATPTPQKTKGKGTGLRLSLQPEKESLHWRLSSKEVKMAQVPDLFEDLKDCYSENEEYSSKIDQLSLNQKSFYDASYDPPPKNHMEQFLSLSTSETSKTSQLTYKKSMVVVAASGKILKKRRLSFNQFITDDDLETIANDPEEEILQPTSVPYSFQGNVSYPFMRVIKRHFILNDNLHQSIIRDTSGRFLMAAALNNLDQAVKFDMGGYKSGNLKHPVTLRISDTRLFLSAQNEGEPVLLKEMPETPKTITDETNLLFFWESQGSKDYFESVAHPKLFIATKQEYQVHMASGNPSIIDLQILEN